jgi:hypothetical protein
VQIDRDVKALPLDVQGGRQVRAYPRQPSGLGQDHDLVEMRVALNDRGRGRLDRIAQVRVGELSAQGADEGCREYNIADQPQPDEQDFHLLSLRPRVDG